MRLTDMGFTSRMISLALYLRCVQCEFEGTFEWETTDERIWQAVLAHRKQCQLEICAWCESERGDKAIQAGIEVTHTICSQCLPIVSLEIELMHGSSAAGTVSHKWKWSPQMEVK